MHQEFIFKIALVIILLSSCKQNQNSFQNVAKKKGNPVIQFERDSIGLSRVAENRLKWYVQYVNSAIEGQCLVILNAVSTKEEQLVNPNIGLMRAKSIIDFYERTYSMNRDRFLVHCSNKFDRKNSLVIMSFDFCITNSEN